MAWVGARAFDQVGVNSFQALVAPMLIDSHELQAAVFEAGIPAQMLEGLDNIDLAGIGVLPGPMRKVLGVAKPFVQAADFAGAIVGLQASELAEQTMLALGATPRAVPSSTDLAGLDAYEQQLGSIVGNRYSATARYVTGNVNLWPRPLVIVMGRNTFESLTPEQQNALRDAAVAAVPDALADAEAEDDSAIPTLCREGMTIAVASNSDIEEMRAAFETVYEQLSSDTATEAYIDAIGQLKDELAAAPEVAACSTAQSSDDPTADGFPEGTYQTTLTADDYDSHGCEDDPEADVPPEGVRLEVTLDDGSVQVLVEVDGTMENGFVGTYDVFRDRIEVTDAIGTVSARWSFDGERLTLSDVVNPLSCDDVVVWTSHPWVLIAD
jgi:TRAP-type C4-dicarboxylate transport system substrate-binding protein